MIKESDLKRHLLLAIIAANRESPHLVPKISYLLNEVAGEVVVRLSPPPRLSDDALKEFRAYAIANPWASGHRLSPSAFIRQHYSKWLGSKTADGGWSGPTLWRTDVVNVQPKLATAYSQEVSRNPDKAINGLYVKPHQLPAGSTRSISAMLVADLSEAEKLQKREMERFKKQKQRKKIKSGTEPAP